MNRAGLDAPSALTSHVTALRPSCQMSMVKQMDPTFPNWKAALNGLTQDGSASGFPAAAASSPQLAIDSGRSAQEMAARARGRQVFWNGDTLVLQRGSQVPAAPKKKPVISFE